MHRAIQQTLAAALALAATAVAAPPPSLLSQSPPARQSAPARPSTPAPPSSPARPSPPAVPLSRLAATLLSAADDRSPAAAAALAALRQAGPDAVPALLAARVAAPIDAERFAARLDAVCAQRDCAASQLFWYTDFAAAQAAAERTGRPILSLRLLGRLDEEWSCANSRFFRLFLYSNPSVNRLLRDGFVLHWSSERPVPKVTIDFGDGRRLAGTVTGNSIHYILDAHGRLVDALPGLYGPQAFRKHLTQLRDLAAHLGTIADDSLFLRLRNDLHVSQLASIQNDLDRDRSRAGIAYKGPRPKPLPAGLEPTPTPTAATAYSAARLAMTKSVGELAPLRSISMAETAALDVDEWARLAALHTADWQLDAGARAELDRRLAARGATVPTGPTGPAGTAERRQTAARFERLVGIDTLRNEYLLHARIHLWLSRQIVLESLAQFNAQVYDQLFLTPRSDPWLGLAAPETFMALTPTEIRP